MRVTRRIHSLVRQGAIVALMLPPLAQAHISNDGGAHHAMNFWAGLAHPFTGADHLFAMLAVGAWSALAMRGRHVWIAPAAFAAMLLVGALLGVAGLALPAVEPMIAASLLVLGLLVASRRALSVPATTVLVGGFAVFHGLAHGTELAAAASVAAALSGMVLGTVLLHVAGMALGTQLQSRSSWLSRAIGASVAVFGAALLIPLVAQAV